LLSYDFLLAENTALHWARLIITMYIYVKWAWIFNFQAFALFPNQLQDNRHQQPYITEICHVQACCFKACHIEPRSFAGTKTVHASIIATWA
jgi:hypothetical protein